MLINNCMQNRDINDFEKIKNSFYIEGYQGDVQIDRQLLDAFTLYMPYCIYTGKEKFNILEFYNNPVNHHFFDQYKQESHALFVVK